MRLKLFLGLALSGSTLLAGCSDPTSSPPSSVGGQQISVNTLPAQAGPLYAPLPQFSVGDRYVFDRNGTEIIAEVTSATETEVTWRSQEGVEWTTQTSLIAPALKWSGDPQSGTGSQKIYGDTYALFPLEAGNTVSFRVEGSSDKQPNGWTIQNVCSVVGPETVSVAAGIFDTFRIDCTRDDRAEALYYAPDIHNLALRVAPRPGGEDRTELLGYRLASPAESMPAMADATPKPMPAGTDDASHGTAPGMAKPVMQSDLKPVGGHGKAMAAKGGSKAMEDPNPVPIYSWKKLEGFQSKELIGPDGKVMRDRTGAPVMITVTDAGIPIDDANGRRVTIAAHGTMQKPATATGPKSGTMMKEPVMLSHSGGAYGVHLASYKSQSSAERGWRILSERFGGDLAGLVPAYRTVDLPGKGRFIRLIADGVSSRGEAQRICSDMKRAGQYCMVMNQG